MKFSWRYKNGQQKNESRLFSPMPSHTGTSRFVPEEKVRATVYGVVSHQKEWNITSSAQDHCYEQKKWNHPIFWNNTATIKRRGFAACSCITIEKLMMASEKPQYLNIVLYMKSPGHQNRPFFLVSMKEGTSFTIFLRYMLVFRSPVHQNSSKLSESRLDKQKPTNSGETSYQGNGS